MHLPPACQSCWAGFPCLLLLLHRRHMGVWHVQLQMGRHWHRTLRATQCRLLALLCMSGLSLHGVLQRFGRRLGRPWGLPKARPPQTGC